MSTVNIDEKIINDLKDLDVDSRTLWTRVKFALDNTYWMQKPKDMEELYSCVASILSFVPISFQDDYNHHIRNLCFKIFKKMLSKGIPSKEVKSAMLKLSFSLFSDENELNGKIIINVIDCLILAGESVDKKFADKYLLSVENLYSNFKVSAGAFIHAKSSSQLQDSSSSSKSITLDGTRNPTVENDPTPEIRTRTMSYSADLVTKNSNRLSNDNYADITNAPITPVLGSILVLERCLFVAIRLFRLFPDLSAKHREPLIRCPMILVFILEALFRMIEAPIYPPSSTSERQYSLYLRVLIYSIFYMGNLLRFFNITQHEYYDRAALFVLQLFVFFPKSDNVLREFLISDIAILCSENYVPRAFLHYLSFLLNSGILFEKNPVTGLSASEHCYSTLNKIITYYSKELSLQDLQNIVYRYCSYIEHSEADFIVARKLIVILTKLVGVMRFHINSKRDDVLLMLGRLCVTYVRKIEDIHRVIKQDHHVRGIRKAYEEYLQYNVQFSDFVHGVESHPPSMDYDENGIRVVPIGCDQQLGDIVVKESQYATVLLLQQICVAIAEIVSFHNHPFPYESVTKQANAPNMNHDDGVVTRGEYPAVDFAQIPISDGLIVLVYRYLVSIFECGELFTVDEGQSQEQLNQCIRHYSDVLSELPSDVKRIVLSCAFPHMYYCIKNNPILLTFVENMVKKTLSNHYTSIVLIDFIVNNLTELETDANDPPILISLFKIFGTRLSAENVEDAMFRPYFRRLLTECIRLMINSSNVMPYLDLLYHCFNIMQHTKLTEIPKDFPLLCNDLVPQLLNLAHVCLDSQVRERIHEIVFHLPIASGNNMYRFVSLLMPFYIHALTGPDKLLISAINYFNTFFNESSTDSMVMIMSNEPFKSRFISALTNILHTTSSSQIIKLVISLLGKLGGRTRSLLKDRIDLASYSYSRDMLLEHDQQVFLTMDSYIILTVSLLERNLIAKSLGDSEITVSRMLHCTRSSVARLRKIRVSYKLTALRGLEHIFYLCCDNDGIPVKSDESYQLKTDVSSNKSNFVSSRSKDQHDEIISLLLYGLLLACCDVEIGDEAMVVVRRISCYMIALLINYTGKRKVDPVSTIPARQFYTLYQELSGVLVTPFPLDINLPPDILSPELVFIVCAALLERDLPNAVDVILSISDSVKRTFQSMIRESDHELWEMFPAVEFFLTAIMRRSIISNWRCKMNSLILITNWYNDMIDIIVFRTSSAVIRNIMDLLSVIPAKFIIQCMDTARRLIRLILVKAFRIEIDASITHESIKVEDQPEISAFIEKEMELLVSRYNDFAVVFVDSLFHFYGPVHEFAKETIELLFNFDPNHDLLYKIVEQLKGRKEFDIIGKLTPQMQMSVFSTMEMALRLNLFSALDPIVLTVVKEAAQLFDSNSKIRELIRMVKPTDYTDKYYIPLNGNGFTWGNSLNVDMYVIVLRLMKVFILQRQALIELHDPNLKEAIQQSMHLNTSIYVCLYPSVNCACDYVINIINPILPYILSLNNGSNAQSYFDANSNVEVLIKLGQELLSGKDISPHYIRRIHIVFDVFDTVGKEKILTSVIQLLQQFRSYFSQTKHIVSEPTFSAVRELYGVLSKCNIDARHIQMLNQIHPQVMDIINRQCPFFVSLSDFNNSLSILCNRYPQLCVDYIYSFFSSIDFLKDDPQFYQQISLIIQYNHSMFFDCNLENVLKEYCRQWDRFSELIVAILQTSSSVKRYIVIKYILHILSYALLASCNFYSPRIKMSLLHLWNLLMNSLEQRLQENREQYEIVRAAKTIQDVSFLPKTYEGDNDTGVGSTTMLLCTCMFIDFDPSVSNRLATVFAYNLLSSMDSLRNYYEVELPKKLTAEQRGSVMIDLLSVLRSSSLNDLKKCCVITYSIIPLLSATCNNHSMDLQVAIPDSFLLPYIREFLPSISTKTIVNSIQYLCALLQLNSLLIKYVTSRVKAEQVPIYTFASDLFASSDSLLQAWSLFFQCQYINSVNYTGYHAVRLYVNILDLFDNPNQELILKSAKLLLPAIHRLDRDNRNKIFARVHQNMYINEHILEQQIHIWKLIVLDPGSFYDYRKVLSSDVIAGLRHLSILSQNAYSKRELSLNILSVITSYRMKSIKEHPDAMISKEMQTAYLFLQIQMLNYVSRTILICSSIIAEQGLCRQGFVLIRNILSLSDQIPIDLNTIDKLSPRHEQTLLFYQGQNPTEEQLYQMVMPLIVVFRLSVMALPYGKATFLDKNAKNLLLKIQRIAEYMDRNYIFCSLIELLPELFSISTPYSVNVEELLVGIRDVMLSIFTKDIKQINAKNLTKATRIWRIVYLIKVILDKTPSVASFFASNMIYFCKELLSIYMQYLAKAPASLRVTSQSSGAVVDFRLLDLPSMPQLTDIEVEYSILLLIELLVNHLAYLNENHSNFITFICSFFKNVQKREMLIRVFQLIDRWTNGEDELLSLQDLRQIFYMINEIRSLVENVMYMGVIHSYWTFIHTLCIRFDVLNKADDQDRVIVFLRLSILSGMISSDPSIRQLFRPLFYKLIPVSLFERLKFLFTIELDYAVKRKWLPLFVEVLLNSKDILSVKLSPNVRRFPSVAVKRNPESSKLSDYMKQVLEVKCNQEKLNVMHIKENVLELAYGDMRLAACIWIDLFPLAWTQFSKQEQVDLAHCIVKFLSSDMHIKSSSSTHLMWEDLDRNYKRWGVDDVLPFCQQAASRYGNLSFTSGTQVILESILRCDPMPQIPPVLLVYLTQIYIGGSQASLILEKMLAECKDVKQQRVYIHCLYKIYESLNEMDAYAAMVKEVNLPELYNGIVLEQYGKYELAQVSYLEGLRNEQLINSSEALRLLETRWKACALNLRQWSLLMQYSKINDDLWLEFYCTEKNNMWMNILPQSYFAMPKTIDVKTIRFEIMFAHFQLIQMIKVGKFNIGILNNILMLFRSILCVLPHQPVKQYDPVLHYIYCYSDIAASANLLNGQKSANDGYLLPFLKSFDECLMNESDCLYYWDDIYAWRASFCSNLIQSGANDMIKKYVNPSSYIICLANIARMQKMPSVASDYLKTLPSEPRDNGELYERWKERIQIITDLGFKEPSVLTELDVLAPESLSKAQWSSVHYLQGKYELMGNRIEESCSYFRKSVQVDWRNYRAWENLGDIYFRQWFERQDANSAQQCMNCCINQLLLKPNKVEAMDRLLLVLLGTLSNSQIAVTCDNFLKIPESVWLSFIPLLLSYPSDSYFVFFLPIITNLIKKYPQIVFYPLTVLAMNAGMPSTDQNLVYSTLPHGTVTGSANAPIMNSVPSRRIASLENVSIVYNTLLSLPQKQIPQLLLFLDTLYAIPHNSYLELLASIDSILADIYDIVAQKGEGALASPVSDELCSKLDNVTELSFSASNSVPSTFYFIYRYAEQFRHDFSRFLLSGAPNHDFPASTLVLYQRLLLWKEFTLKEYKIDYLRFSFEIFMSRSRFIPDCVMIPTNRFSVINYTIMTRTIQNIHYHDCTPYKDFHQNRQIDLVDNEAKIHQFAIEQIQEVDALLEEQVEFFQSHFESLMSDVNVVQQRHLHSSIPAYFNIAPTLRLVRTHCQNISLEGILREEMRDEFDQAQMKYALKLYSVRIGKDTLQEEGRTDYLIHYAFNHLNSLSDYYTFRSEFSRQYAYSQFISFLFANQHQSLSNIVVNFQTGDVYAMNMHGNYVFKDRRYLLVDNSAVKLRLTPSISKFLTQYYEFGNFQFALGAFTLAFQQHEEALQTYMKLMERTNTNLLMRNEEVDESTIISLFNDNTKWLTHRGICLAPDVNVRTIQTKEKLDKAIVDAIAISKNPFSLAQMGPSFCAWFYYVCKKQLN